jgi:hypothetical protein
MRGLATCVIVVAIGCGGGDGGGKPSIGTTQDNVCSEIAAVACYNMYSCCSEGEIERYLGVTDPRSQDDCIVDIGKLCERSLASIDFSLKNNRIKFDAATMNACLTAIEAPDGTCATIATMLPWTMACMNSAWVGITADGAACNYTYECGMDSLCSTAGACTAKPGIGQPCSTGCASGLYCAGSTCAPLLTSGQMCSSNQQCAKSLFCDTSATSPTCTALRDTGQACTGNASCTSNKCNPGTCAVTFGTCYTNSNCSMHCSNSSSFCSTDSNCGLGTCAQGGTSCSSDAGCSGVGNTCVFTNHCVPGSCTGNVVCADNEITVDYCKDALSAVPLP